MIEWNCCKCGIVGKMPTTLNEQLIANHKTFYCVHGHSQCYAKKTSIEEVEEKLMNEYAKNAQLEKRVKDLENRGLVERLINKK